jgi:hypothetical protein
MAEPLVADFSITRSRVAASAHKTLHPELIAEEVWVESPTLDFSSLGEADAVLPLALNAAPLVWSLGVELGLNGADQELVESLERAREAMGKLWPDFDWPGRVIANSAAPSATRDRKTVLLFSGGLDSTFSAFSLLDERPTLLTVHGGRDLALADAAAWKATSAVAENFAEKYGLEHHAVQSNFTSALTPAVDARFQQLPVSYWAAIQHGLGLTGVAAPVMAALRADRLVVSATHSTGHTAGWGSHPTLEGQLRWSTAKVQHFGYDHDRTAKVVGLVRIARERGIELPHLIVCTRRKRDGNCLSCPKCLRTMGSVLVAGVQPREFGFEISAEQARQRLKDLVPAAIAKSDNEKYAWGAISRAAEIALEAEPKDKFLRWLSRLDKPRRRWF